MCWAHGKLPRVRWSRQFYVLSVWALSGYSSYYHSQAQFVENGAITAAGYVLQIKEALINGAVSSGVMAIFWFIAIFKPNSKVANA